MRDLADVAALQAAVVEEVETLRAQHGGRGLLVRVVLQGRGPVASHLRHAAGAEDFLAELRAHFAGREPFVWIEALKNRAQAELDLDAMRQRDDFAAELLQRYDGVLRGADAAPADFVAQAAPALGRPGQVLSALRAAEEAAGDARGAGHADDAGDAQTPAPETTSRMRPGTSSPRPSSEPWSCSARR